MLWCHRISRVMEMIFSTVKITLRREREVLFCGWQQNCSDVCDDALWCTGTGSIRVPSVSQAAFTCTVQYS